MPGLTAGVSSNFQTKSGAYTVLATDAFVQANISAGGFTLTLPNAVTYANPVLVVSCTQGTTNALTLATQLSQTVNGTTTFVMGGPLQPFCVWLVSDGANWQLFEHAYPPTLLQTASVLLGTTLSGVAPTSFTTMTGMTLSITTKGNSRLYVHGSASVSEAGTAQPITLRIQDTTTGSTYAQCRSENDGLAGGMPQSFALVGDSGATLLAAGTHTLAMQWQIASSSVTCSSGFAYFNVMEVTV